MRFSSDLESAYQIDLASEKIRVVWQTYALCTLLYAGFGVLDIWAMPSMLNVAWMVRGAIVVMNACIVLLAITRRDWFIRHYPSVTALSYFIWGVGIEYILALAVPSDSAWHSYYAGLLLVFMGLYTWTYLRFGVACIVGVALTALYLGIAIGVQRMVEHGQWHILVGNCFFLVSANIIGMFSMHTRERFSREAFLLKSALKRDLILKDEAKRQSDFLAEHDLVTGLLNRPRFLRELQAMLDAEAENPQIVVLFLDLDKFKLVNDVYGNVVGDQVLLTVARRILNCIRDGDIAARVGSDEFVVALPVTDADDSPVDLVTRSLRIAIEQPMKIDDRIFRVMVSIGKAGCVSRNKTAQELIADADRDMTQHREAAQFPAEARALLHLDRPREP
ncbi:MAG TPA: diguanylate cyclase [Paucimonas sp.]|nr:diguanylate cyclase [Paucimonas sp.]